jgi:hypothetical protein
MAVVRQRVIMSSKDLGLFNTAAFPDFVGMQRPVAEFCNLFHTTLPVKPSHIPEGRDKQAAGFNTKCLAAAGKQMSKKSLVFKEVDRYNCSQL